MGCCSSNSPPPRIPRKNGLSWPPHFNQVIYWIVLIVFEIFYNGVEVPSLQKQWRIPAYIILNVVFVLHIITHFRVLRINPANPVLIENWPDYQPDLDKTRHQHVVENQHCNVCQISVPDGGKHCGKCNKCVTDFDHHCTWLNTCIGGKNYVAFLACVSTTVAWCSIIFVVTMVLIVMYFVNKSWLSPSRDVFAFASNSTENITGTNDIASYNSNGEALNQEIENNVTIIKSSSDSSLVVFVPVKDEVWLAIMILYAAMSGYIDGLVIYLLGFHAYLICTGQSTYHVMRKDRVTPRLNVDGPLKKSLYRSCLSHKSKIKCRVSQVKEKCAKGEGTSRLDVATSTEDMNDGRDAKEEGIHSTVLISEDGVLPSQIPA